MRIIFVFLIMLSAISCKDENKYPKEDSNCNACGVSAPQRNLEWLVKKIAECKVSTDKTKHFFMFMSLNINDENFSCFRMALNHWQILTMPMIVRGI